MDRAIHGTRRLRYAAPTDWDSVIALEEQIFDDAPTLFKLADIQRIHSAQEKFLVISGNAKGIDGYLSLLLLNRTALRYCLRNEITSICKLPTELLPCTPKDCSGVFFEVIAFGRNISQNCRKPLVSVLYEAMNRFAHLPSLCCPVTEVGMHIVQKNGFSPLAEAGLNRPYLRGPGGATKWTRENGMKQAS